MANVLTSLRIVGTLVMLFLNPTSLPFYIVYAISGLTDILDGWIARLTHTVSALGSRLDSAADLLFYAVMLTKIFPLLWVRLPKLIWLWVVLILAMRAASYAIAYKKTRTLSSLHTVLNKLTGLCVFLVPYFLPTGFFTLYCLVLCAIGTLSSAQDLTINMKDGGKKKPAAEKRKY